MVMIVIHLNIWRTLNFYKILHQADSFWQQKYYFINIFPYIVLANIYTQVVSNEGLEEKYYLVSKVQI